MEYHSACDSCSGLSVVPSGPDDPVSLIIVTSVDRIQGISCRPGSLLQYITTTGLAYRSYIVLGVGC